MKKLLILCPFFILLLGCSSNDSENVENNPAVNLSSQKQILNFSFSSSNNNIPVNSNGDVENNSVSIFLPVNTDLSSLIPNFTISENASSFVNNQEITSGVTNLDFSNNLTIEIVAEDGTTKNYNIEVITNFTGIDNSINFLMSNYNIPGVQLAIIKDEKLVYTKSYGFADEDNNELVNDESLFRIASISKPITAIGILKLAEMNLLSLNDTVFGAGGILGSDYGTIPYSNDIEQITVKHLLEHKSGWANIPFDPMFNNLNFTHSQLISDMVDNRPLTTSPGSTYYYSNFGYCVLGRIIEKVSNTTYETFIKQNLFIPSDITNMEIAGNTIDEIYANEVVYYDQENFSPYSMNVTRMDSHGGWIASATDLAKFLSKIDRNTNREDLVNQNSLQELYFGFQNWIFYGSLPGSSTAISRVNNSFSYVLLANTRTIPIDGILNNMNTIMQSRISSRSEWPDYDLF